jgi:hypothetical protein
MWNKVQFCILSLKHIFSFNVVVSISKRDALLLVLRILKCVCVCVCVRVCVCSICIGVIIKFIIHIKEFAVVDEKYSPSSFKSLECTTDSLVIIIIIIISSSSSSSNSSSSRQ